MPGLPTGVMLRALGKTSEIPGPSGDKGKGALTHPAGTVTGIDEETGLPIVRRRATLAPENKPAAESSPVDKTSVPRGANSEETPKIGETEEETDRPVLHQSPHPEVNQAAATAEHPIVKTQLADAIKPIDGAELAGARAEKEPERVDEKIEDGQSPRTIRDYSGYRIAVDSPEAKDQVVKALKERFEVPNEQDEFNEGNAETGFHGHTLQVREPGSPISHEVQVLPREVADNADARHSLYEKARAGDKDAAAQMKAANEADWEQFHARTNSEKGGSEKPEQEPAKGKPAPEPKYKFGSTQANIPEDSEAAKALKVAREKIAPEDRAGEVNGAEGGIETKPHVTVRYGIQGDDVEGIRKYLAQQQPFEAKLGKTGKFPPSDHSDGAVPIMAAVEAPELHRMEKEIDQHGDFAERSFLDYKPHATLGYVKPEAASKYVGMPETEGKRFKVSSIGITDRQGNVTEVPLGGAGKGSRVVMKDGSSGQVQYLHPAFNGAPPIARVRLDSGQIVRSVNANKLTPEDPKKWVGVDLDGTLALYDGFKGKTAIGQPIPAMVDRVKRWLDNGQNVKILTARVSDDKDGEAKRAIQDWAEKHLGARLDVTDVKDANMSHLYDDRAVSVERNTGKLLAQPQPEKDVPSAVIDRFARLAKNKPTTLRKWSSS